MLNVIRLCTLELVKEVGDLVIVHARYRGMPDAQSPEEFEVTREDWARKENGGHVCWLTDTDEIVIMPDGVRPYVAEDTRNIRWMALNEVVEEGHNCLRRISGMPRGAQRNKEVKRVSALIEMLNMPV